MNSSLQLTIKQKYYFNLIFHFKEIQLQNWYSPLIYIVRHILQERTNHYALRDSSGYEELYRRSMISSDEWSMMGLLTVLGCRRCPTILGC